MADWLKRATPADTPAAQQGGPDSPITSPDSSSWLSRASKLESSPEQEDLQDVKKIVHGYLADTLPGPLGEGYANLIEKEAKFALPIAATVGKTVDKYTGAPTRAAVGSLQAGGGLLGAAKTFGKQFGENPDLAPTGKDIARKAGVSDTLLSDYLPGVYTKKDSGGLLRKGGLFDPSASGAAGLGVDIASDWSNFIPAKAALKGLGRVSGATKELELAGKGVKDFTEPVTKIVDSILSPKRAANFEEAVNIAKKNGIDPDLLNSSIEFGRDSLIARGERGLREGPTGEKLFEKYNQGHQAISDAIDNQVTKMAGTAIPNEAVAGQALQQGFKDAQNHMLQSMDMTYKKAGQYAPGIYINKDELEKINSKLNGIEKFAKGRISRGITNVEKEQGSQLLAAVDAVRNTKGKYGQFVETMQDLGSHAFPSKPIIGQVPVDIEKFSDLYHSMTDAAINTVRKDINPAFADELVKNNEVMSSFFGHRSTLAGILESGKADENIFRALTSDTKKLDALKQTVAPETFNLLKGAMLNGLIKRDVEGAVNFASTIKSLQKNRVKLGAVFSPEEMANISEIVKLGHDYGPAILSSSGTGASHAYKDVFKKIPRAIIDEKFIESRKAKARGLIQDALPPPPGGEPALLPQAQALPGGKDVSTVGKGHQGLLGRYMDMNKRGPFSSKLKALQSTSPTESGYERKK